MSEKNPQTPDQALSGKFTTNSAEETYSLGKRIGERLEGGEIFLLRGDLGAGKTVFAKGLAAGLGIDPADVTSPSFTLINIHEGRSRMYHIDLYRLDTGMQSGLGLDEILDDDRAVIVVEWAERLGFVPEGSIIAQIFHLSDEKRRILIESTN